MHLMLVYRFLRKISGWALAGFYSEIYVVGQENIPKDGPIILAATHHNELIDILTLAVTIPHRRHICYWAKSTLFENPLFGPLMRACESIPVYRNPSGPRSPNGPLTSELASSTTSQADLFKHTTVALAKGEAIGVFPEGTSYTEPAIAQVKDGAAWAAIEYVKDALGRTAGEPKKELMIVPVAIVYRDKSQYQSQVVVQYGKPIRVDGILAGRGVEDDRATVREITREIYRRLKEMTINAPDWDTYNGARIAVKLAEGADLRIDRFVGVSQRLVELLSDQSQEIRGMKQSLVRYLGLLHYTGISHAALDYLYPFPEAITPASSTIPTVPIASLTMLYQLYKTFLHPSTIAFLPMFILHLPVYISGWLAARLLTAHNREEAKAQLKVAFGVLATGLLYAMVIRSVFNVMHGGGDMTGWLSGVFPQSFIATVGALEQRLQGDEGLVQKLIGVIVVAVGTVRILWEWHTCLIKGNIERWNRLSASVKILIGLMTHTSSDMSEAGLAAYSRPPPPAKCRFIKRAVVNDQSIDPPQVSSATLIRPLLAARVDAVAAVRKLEAVRGVREGGEVELLELPNREGD